MIDEIAKSEGISKRKLKKRVERFSVVIVKNSKRDIKPLAIGE